MMNLRLLNRSGSTASEIETSQQLPSLRTLTCNNDSTLGFMGNMGESLDCGQDDGRDHDVYISEEQTIEEPDI